MTFRANHRREPALVLVVLLGACVDGDPTTPDAQIPTDGRLLSAPTYLVQLEAGVDPATVLHEHGATATRVYTESLNGFAAKMLDPLRFSLIEDPRVLRIEPDEWVAATGGEQSLPDWGLDRIDQRGGILDGSWRYDYEGRETTAYVVDTGVRWTHTDFGGRANHGYDALGGNGLDCNGHGTHVAGSIAGTRHGVAKAGRVVSVRVLDCDGNGKVSDVVAGLDWVLTNHPGGPAVINLSFGGLISASLDMAVQRALDAGFLVVSSAGNTGEDACLFSPARVDGVLTVGATDRSDTRPEFSNTGPCVDLFAPGVQILSAHHGSDIDEAVFTGTSSAAPLATGVALMALERTPSLGADALHAELWALSTRNVVRSADSPNPHLLFAPQAPENSDPLPPPPPPPPPIAAPTGLATSPDTKSVQLQVGWEVHPSADEIEIAWRPSGSEWQTDRVRHPRPSAVLRHLRSATRYEVRIRARARSAGSWVASEWSESMWAETCVRRGKSSQCETAAGG